MITYTVDEARELGLMFDSVYDNTGFYSNIIEDSIHAEEDPRTVIQDFLGGTMALGVTQEGADKVFAMVFDTDIEEMPLYINDALPWKRAIASWRLKIGK